jgi:hypothetical protein
VDEDVRSQVIRIMWLILHGTLQEHEEADGGLGDSGVCSADFSASQCTKSITNWALNHHVILLVLNSIA